MFQTTGLVLFFRFTAGRHYYIGDAGILRSSVFCNRPEIAFRQRHALRVFPFFALAFLLFVWLAGRTSRKSD